MSVLSDATALLGPPVKMDHRGWATWWCPFHDDAAKKGARGQPNFGINLQGGYWKCLRCGQSGGSIAGLRIKLGEWHTPISSNDPTEMPREPAVGKLGEALSEVRAALTTNSPGWEYVQSRGVTRGTALQYGLGYGLPRLNVHLDTITAARDSRLLSQKGFWLWSGGIVYAEPPTNPTTIQVRHLRQGVDKKYQTWGRLMQPLGCWRLSFTTTRVVVVEGMMDMLVTNQFLQHYKVENTVAVYTGGASISNAMQAWFAASPYDYVLIPDGDQAGEDWTDTLVPAIRHAGGTFIVSETPDNLDPDEALLKGWWPPGIPVVGK